MGPGVADQCRDAVTRRGPVGEHGGLSVEWVALAALVVALTTALVVTGAGRGMGDTLAQAACRVITSVGDGPAVCGDVGDVGDSGDGTELATVTCLDSRTHEQAGGDVTLFSVRVDGDLAYQIDRMSDGTYDVTLQMSGGLAAEAVAGGKLSADELGMTQGRQGEVRAGAEAEIAPVYSFDSQQEAEEFAESARDLVAGPIDDALDWRSLIPGYGPGRIAYNQYGRIRDFDPPDPSRLRVEGGLDVTAEGSMYGGGGGVEGLLSRGTSMGAEFDLETGEKTIYVALDGEVAAQAGLQVTPAPGATSVGGSGELDGEVVVALTVDEHLRPTELGIGVTLTGSGGFQGLGAADLDGIFSGLDLTADVGHGAFALSGNATLDLTDPHVGEIGHGLLDALASGNASELADAGGEVRDHLVHETNLEAFLHTGDRDAFDVGGRGGKGLAFGFGLEHERSEIELAGAWHRPPGGDFAEALCG